MGPRRRWEKLTESKQPGSEVKNVGAHIDGSYWPFNWNVEDPQDRHRADHQDHWRTTRSKTQPPDPQVITEPLPGIVQWATGRGTHGVTAIHNGAPLAETPAAQMDLNR